MPFHQMGIVLKPFYSQIKIKLIQTFLTSVTPLGSQGPHVLPFHMKSKKCKQNLFNVYPMVNRVHGKQMETVT